jgi:proteasome accessory factor C
MAAKKTSRRLRRVLELVPWVLSRPQPPGVDETCERFGITRAQLAEDLDLMFLCGVYPFTPDTLIEAWIDHDQVVVQSGLFTRMPRPDPGEALALVAAGRAIAQTPGAPEALRRGLAKVEKALPGKLARGLVVDLEADDLVADIRRALAGARRIEIQYFSYTRDELTTRKVDPGEVFSANGSWYMAGWCHLAQAPRCFRVDRIRELAILDEPAEQAEGARGMEPSYESGEDDVLVTLRLSPRATWLGDYYPLESVQPLADGGARVVLATGSPQWLRRLLLRLGPDARVEQPGGIAQMVKDAAEGILARYHASPPSVGAPVPSAVTPPSATS